MEEGDAPRATPRVLRENERTNRARDCSVGGAKGTVKPEAIAAKMEAETLASTSPASGKARATMPESKAAAAAGQEQIVIDIIPDSNSRLRTSRASNDSNHTPAPKGLGKLAAIIKKRPCFESFRFRRKDGVNTNNAFKPLLKVELQVANGSRWMWARRCLVTVFWLAWLSMLAAALVIIVRTPDCKPAPKLKWWQKSPMYHIAIQSYFDRSGNGVGDLLGIQQKLKYIRRLNIGTIIIEPFYSFLGNSNESRSIDRRFGNINELKPLIKTATKYGIKIVLDLTPNLKGVEDYTWTDVDFYDDHMLDDLLIIDLLRAWKDISRRYSTSAKKRSRAMRRTIIYHWRRWKRKTKFRFGFRRLMYQKVLKIVFIIGTETEESDHLISVLREYEGNMMFIYYLTDLMINPNLNEIAVILNHYQHKMEAEWCGFFLVKGHFSTATLKRNGGIYARLFIMLFFSMPGTPIIYYGDEIGLKDYKATTHPLMRWDDDIKFAGFTKSSPWILPDLSVYTPSVLQQEDDPQSTLSYYRKLGKIRSEELSLQYGDFNVVSNSTNYISFIRQWERTGILVVLNFGAATTIDFTAVYLPSTALLLVQSEGLTPCGLISMKKMKVEANTGYILKYFIEDNS